MIALAGLLVAVAKDQEVGELGLGISNITEECGDVVAAEEGFPVFEDGVLGVLVFGSGAGGRELERRAECTMRLARHFSISVLINCVLI